MQLLFLSTSSNIRSRPPNTAADGNCDGEASQVHACPIRESLGRLLRLRQAGKAGVAWAGVRALFCLGRGSNRGESALIRNSLLFGEGLELTHRGRGGGRDRRRRWCRLQREADGDPGMGQNLCGPPRPPLNAAGQAPDSVRGPEPVGRLVSRLEGPSCVLELACCRWREGRVVSWAGRVPPAEPSLRFFSSKKKRENKARWPAQRALGRSKLRQRQLVTGWCLEGSSSSSSPARLLGPPVSAGNKLIFYSQL